MTEILTNEFNVLIVCVIAPISFGLAVGALILNYNKTTKRSIAGVDILSFCITAIPIIFILSDRNNLADISGRSMIYLKLGDEQIEILKNLSDIVERICTEEKLTQEPNFSDRCPKIIQFLSDESNQEIANPKFLKILPYDQFTSNKMGNFEELKIYNQKVKQFNKSLRETRDIFGKKVIDFAYDNFDNRAILTAFVSFGIGVGLIRRIYTFKTA